MREQQERRLKVLWIARTCPYPANDGEKLRVFNLLKAVAERHDLTIVYRVMADDENQGAAELNKFCTGGAHGIHVPRPQGLMGKLRWLLPFVFSRYPIALCTVYFEPIRQRLAEAEHVHVFEHRDNAKPQPHPIRPDAILHPRRNLAFQQNQIRHCPQNGQVRDNGDIEPGRNVRNDPVQHGGKEDSDSGGGCQRARIASGTGDSARFSRTDILVCHELLSG